MGVDIKFAVLSTSTRKGRLDLNEINISQKQGENYFSSSERKAPHFFFNFVRNPFLREILRFEYQKPFTMHVL